MFAHRRVACTAIVGNGGAQFDDATDEIEDDLVGREVTLEITDSGEETEETERAKEDRRDVVGNTAGALGFHW